MMLTLKNTTLRFAEVADAAFILELRTNDLLSQYLNKTDNDLARQEQWLQSYKEREARKEEYYFIVQDRATAGPQGTVRIYNIQGTQYTSGSWIIKKGAAEEVSFVSDFLVTYFAFEVLRFETCYFDVRKDNKKVLSFHKRFAAPVKEDEENIYLIMDQKGYQKKKAFFQLLLGTTDADLQVSIE